MMDFESDLPSAGLQASALEADASVKRAEKRLAAKGAAAAMPRAGESFMVEESEDDYSSVEEDDFSFDPM